MSTVADLSLSVERYAGVYIMVESDCYQVYTEPTQRAAIQLGAVVSADVWVREPM